jgi:hypothetical protein
MTKFIVVSGGVISGIGKGVIGEESGVFDIKTWFMLILDALVLDSLVDWLAAEDSRSQSHSDKD